MREIYLDFNATTPPHPLVIERMLEALQGAWGNPASVHASGRKARRLLEEARETAADFLGISARDLVFTSGGTEANNLALARAPALVTSRVEHPSIVRVAERLEEQGTPVRWVPVAGSGCIDPGNIARALVGLPPKAVVAVQAANHETGVVQPLEAVYPVVHAAGAWLHVDAVQAAGKLDPLRWRVFDSVTISAHKLRGPKGIGALGFRPGRSPVPVLLGGAQERGLRAGTQDAALAHGLRTALELAGDGPQRFAKVAVLRDLVERSLADLAEVNGAGATRLPHVSNLSFTGWRGDEIVAAMDLNGVRVSSGSACSAGSSEPSPVITAMAGGERASSAVRISLGDDTSEQAILEAISAFRRVVTGALLQ